MSGAAVFLDTTDGATVRAFFGVLRVLVDAGLDGDAVDSILHGF